MHKTLHDVCAKKRGEEERGEREREREREKGERREKSKGAGELLRCAARAGRLCDVKKMGWVR